MNAKEEVFGGADRRETPRSSFLTGFSVCGTRGQVRDLEKPEEKEGSYEAKK
jgi:hypothetical protein